MGIDGVSIAGVDVVEHPRVIIAVNDGSKRWHHDAEGMVDRNNALDNEVEEEEEEMMPDETNGDDEREEEADRIEAGEQEEENGQEEGDMSREGGEDGEGMREEGEEEEEGGGEEEDGSHPGGMRQLQARSRRGGYRGKPGKRQSRASRRSRDRRRGRKFEAEERRQRRRKSKLMERKRRSENEREKLQACHVPFRFRDDPAERDQSFLSRTGAVRVLYHDDGPLSSIAVYTGLPKGEYEENRSWRRKNVRLISSLQ